MAITTTQLDALPDYTDAQMVKVCKKAIVDILAGGQNYSINGRTLSRADLDKVTNMLSFFEERVEAAGNTDGTTTALAEFTGP